MTRKQLEVLIILTVVVGAIATWPSETLAAPRTAVCLGNNGLKYAGWPKVSGNHVVWEAWGDQKSHLLYYDGSTVSELDNTSDDSYMNYGYGVSGDTVAWVRGVNNRLTLFVYDGTSITTPDVGLGVMVGNNSVLYGGAFGDIKVYKGGDIRTIGNCPDGGVMFAGINSHGAAYSYNVGLGYTPPQDISALYYWDGSTTRRITDDTHDVLYPGMSENLIAWWDPLPGGGYTLYKYDGSDIEHIWDAESIAGPMAPKVSGQRIVWCQRPPGETTFQVFEFADGAVRQLTHVTYGITAIAISGSNTVWECSGPIYDPNPIYLYDGYETTLIVDTGAYPEISGENIVYVGAAGVFLSTPVPEPSSLLVLLCALLFSRTQAQYRMRMRAKCL